jgi:sec-independent protein translocase protein TatA
MNGPGPNAPTTGFATRGSESEEVAVGELSAWHWAVVVVVAVLLFGSERLPEAARSIGRSARILRAELRAGTDGDGRGPTD